MSYRSLFRQPFVVRLLAGSWIGRLPFAMASLAIPLALRHAGQTYGFVGLAVAVYAVSGAVGSPIGGRLVDRFGQVRILVPTVIASGAGFALIALAPHARPLVLIGAALAGAATPPLEPCLRTLWPTLVPPDDLERAYATDSAAQELIFVTGPLVVALAILIFRANGTLIVGALLGVVGVAVFATATPSRSWVGERHAGHWLGALRSRPLVVLLLSLVGAGFAVGVLNVYAVDYAERHHVFGGAPALIALNATGAFIGALLYGGRRWRMSERARVLVFMCGLAVGYGLLVLQPAPGLMAVVMVATGLFLAPLLTVTFLMVGRLAPPGTATEAFAWEVTLFTTGVSAGAAVVGAVIEHSGSTWAAACAVFGVVAGLITLLAGYGLVREPSQPPEPGESTEPGEPRDADRLGEA